jgi:predicted alpha/beta hydrolase family esterase
LQKEAFSLLRVAPPLAFHASQAIYAVMEVVLGPLPARLERPQTRKFAWPAVVLPELFATQRHLDILVGYLVSLGWEVYALDLPLRAAPPPEASGTAPAFSAALSLVREAVNAIGSDVVAVGHGLGGVFALKLAEVSPVRAVVAVAPLVPGFLSPLFARRPGPLSFLRSVITGLPRGRLLDDLVAGADPFQRAAIIDLLIPADTSPAMEVARGAVEFTGNDTPRLVIAGEADQFAPSRRAAQFADQIGAGFVSLKGRGHWLIGGKGLERAVAELQRFLVRTLGEELLLLYSSADDAQDPE